MTDALTDYPGNMIFSSHDHQFIDTIANRIIELAPNVLVDFRGTFDEYLAGQYRSKRKNLFMKSGDYAEHIIYRAWTIRKHTKGPQ